MRFTSADGYTCTLLTANIGVYGSYLAGNPAGTPDMKVTVYDDDGFGLYRLVHSTVERELFDKDWDTALRGGSFGR